MPRKMQRLPTKSESGEMRIQGNQQQLLGHIVSKDGIAVDPDKVKAILEAPAPTTAKALSRF